MMGHATYLIFELAWAIPVLLLQWAVGHRDLRRSVRVLIIAVSLSTVYLSCTDAVAIGVGIWTLHADRIVGLRFGVVPVEEIIFFTLTNAMVAQSVILVRAFLQRRSISRSSVAQRGA